MWDISRQTEGGLVLVVTCKNLYREKAVINKLYEATGELYNLELDDDKIIEQYIKQEDVA